MSKRKVAVFDIDGTIFRSSLLIELTEELISSGQFPPEARKNYAQAYERWLDRKDHYDKYIWGVIRAFEKHIRGVSEKDFLRAVRKVIAFHQFRVYRHTRELVRRLKRQKYFLLAISHSPKLVVEGFAKRMGFDKVYGRMLELDESRCFTGRVMHEDLIRDKEKILERALLKENLTLRGSVGVGDTDSDVSFLKRVKRPICFNPNQALYRIARRRKWEVFVERKDVVYRIK